MERYYYGAGTNMGFGYSGSELLKADAPMLSTTAGTYQAIYGRKVWSQLNQEFNAFSILPKKPWDRSGWRVVTAKPSTAVGGGIAENGTLPDTTKPTFQNVAAKPKTIAHSFDMSEVAIFLNDKDDGLGDIRSVLKKRWVSTTLSTSTKCYWKMLQQQQVTTLNHLTELLLVTTA